MVATFWSRFQKYLILPLFAIFLAGCDANEKEESADHKTNHGITESETGTTQEEGVSDAETDIASGKLRVWTQPLPSPPWANRYFNLARDNGIELKATSKPDDFHTAYIQSYNKRMNQEIEKKFGPGFLGKLEQQAQKETDSKLPEKGN